MQNQMPDFPATQLPPDTIYIYAEALNYLLFIAPNGTVVLASTWDWDLNSTIDMPELFLTMQG